MRRLIESTLVSLDGVVEAPERWAGFDAEDAALSLAELDKYDAFVMGRVTYENFFANWGHVTGNPYIDVINAMPKYVASRSLAETTWNATLLGPDPSDEIARQKDQPGKDREKQRAAGNKLPSLASQFAEEAQDGRSTLGHRGDIVRQTAILVWSVKPSRGQVGK